MPFNRSDLDAAIVRLSHDFLATNKHVISLEVRSPVLYTI